MKAAAFALLLVSACAGAPPAVEDAQRPLPAFPQLKPAPAGEERILLTARGAGFLAWQGWCLGISHGDGTFTTLIWPETARLERVPGGIAVTDSLSGARIRVGDYFTWGGGDGPLPPPDMLTEPVRPECAARTASVNPGLEKAKPPR
jgi:hypothetical protein